VAAGVEVERFLEGNGFLELGDGLGGEGRVESVEGGVEAVDVGLVVLGVVDLGCSGRFC
jgi:hypothetical protein